MGLMQTMSEWGSIKGGQTAGSQLLLLAYKY